jgi:protein TonB
VRSGRPRARLLRFEKRAAGDAPQDGALPETPPWSGAPVGRSRARGLGVALVLALLIHAAGFFALRWGPLALPAREMFVRIVHVAADRSGAREAPPPPAPRVEPARPAPARRIVAPAPARESVPAPKRPPAPVEAEAATTAPSAPTAPSGDGARETPVASENAPGASAAISAHPRYKNNPEPEYPAAARRRGQQGTVLLTVRVDMFGRPESVAIATSSGFSALDAAAIAAVQHWEFEPGRLAGVPVPSQVEVPIRFQLDAGSD